MLRPRRCKASDQRLHANLRCKERFGFTLGRKGMRAIVEMIAQGKAEFVDRQSNRVTRWKVRFGGVEMIAVYDKKRKQLATVLPVDWVCQ